MAGHNEYLAVQSDNEMSKKNQMAGENLLHLLKTKQSGRPIFVPISSPGIVGKARIKESMKWLVALQQICL